MINNLKQGCYLKYKANHSPEVIGEVSNLELLGGKIQFDFTYDYPADDGNGYHARNCTQHLILTPSVKRSLSEPTMGEIQELKMRKLKE